MRGHNVHHSKHSKFIKNFGFSLIEIILVIAILGVIGLVTINGLQQKAQQIKITKAVVQIQQIFTAAEVYYFDDKHGWPASCEMRVLGDYLPIGLTKNPWGKDYTCAPTDDGKLFKIITVVDNDLLAAQISAKLPMAEAQTGGQVVAEIPIPFEHTDSLTAFGFPKLVQISDSLMVGSTNSPAVPHFDGTGAVNIPLEQGICPPNQKARVIVLPTSLEFAMRGEASYSSQYTLYTSSTPDIREIGHNPNAVFDDHFTYYFRGYICGSKWLDMQVTQTDTPWLCNDGDPRFGLVPLSGEVSHILTSGGNGGVNLNYMVYCAST